MPKKIKKTISSETAILDDKSYLVFHNWKKEAKLKWRFCKID